MQLTRPNQSLPSRFYKRLIVFVFVGPTCAIELWLRSAVFAAWPHVPSWIRQSHVEQILPRYVPWYAWFDRLVGEIKEEVNGKTGEYENDEDCGDFFQERFFETGDPDDDEWD